MRVTDNMRYGSVLRNLTSLTARQSAASQQALTGNRINAPSDDALGAAELVRTHSALSRTKTERQSLTNARGDVEMSEGVLDQANALFQRAHEIAMQGSNGNLSQENRHDLATEVGYIKQQLLSLANARGSRGYLFGGSKTQTPPFAASGAFSGDDEAQMIQIGSSSPTRVSASGASAFTSAGGRDVFADLDALATALTADDQTAVSATLPNLEASRSQLVREQSQVGLILDRLDTSDAALEQAELAFSKREQQVGAADTYEAYSQMTTLAQSLERSITVSRQILDLGGNNRF